MPLKKCVVCDSEFKARLSAYKTCGTVCRNRLIAAEKEVKHTITKPCQVCGTMFSNTGKQKNRKTCSTLCGHVLTGRARQSRESRSCATCGVGFEATAGSTDKYCSATCGYGRNMTDRPCEVCGTIFRSPPSQSHLRTCSNNCAAKIRRIPHKVGATYMAVSAKGNLYAKLTPARLSAKNSRRRALRLMATPSWADLAAILEIYEECQRMNAATGIVHHVDHIVPLISMHVCGLHCEANLRVITGFENMSKHNRRWPDMP